MYTGLMRSVAVMVAVGAMLMVPVGDRTVVSAQADQPPSTCFTCDQRVAPTGEGLLGQVRAEVERLNQYSSNPVPCHGVDERDDDGTESIGEFDGHWRWRMTRRGDEAWHESNDTEPGAGTYYRRKCWSPEAGDFGDYDEIVLFPNITPQNLARLAMDDFFLRLPPPDPRFSPAGTTLVDLDTWLWVAEIPANSVEEPLVSEVISVPGVDQPGVQASAWSSGVQWDMGDGTVIDCAGTGVPYVVGGPENQTSECTHRYQASSATQGDGQYHGTATIVWTGTYTVNGVLAPEEFLIVRETPFVLGVAEAQALNTDD